MVASGKPLQRYNCIVSGAVNDFNLNIYRLAVYLRL